MGREERRGTVQQPAAAGAAAPALAALSQWQCTVAGLQHNLQQFASNLAQIQSRMCSELVQAKTKQLARAAGPPFLAPAAQPVASLSHAAVAPGAAGSWGGVDSYGSTPGSTAGSSMRVSGGGGGAVSKEEVGRATWTFLHTLAAQFPESPTRQQQRDARNLVSFQLLGGHHDRRCVC